MSAAVLAVTAHLSVRDVLQTIVASARRLLDARYAALGVPGRRRRVRRVPRRRHQRRAVARRSARCRASTACSA